MIEYMSPQKMACEYLEILNTFIKRELKKPNTRKYLRQIVNPLAKTMYKVIYKGGVIK